MRTARTPIIALLLLAAGTAMAQEKKFAADRPIDATHMRLDLRVDLPGKSVEATATLDFIALRPLTTISLDAVGMKIHEVTFKRGSPEQPEPVRFENDGKKLLILLRQPLPAGAAARAVVRYTVSEPETGLHFYGPTKEEPDTPYQVWSQGETVDNRHWIPCPDQPNERLTSELFVTTRAELDVLSNGKLVSRKDNGDGTATVHWSQTTDHVPYLITLVVGKFAKEEQTWRGKPIRYWVPPDRGEDIRRSFGNTVRMLDFFSSKIGVEYPWDQYAQVVVEQFSFGGMENTSATTLNERTLHDAKAHLDFSSDGLVAHELAHQWFGDLLTCTDWAHIWLNEGFATYFEALWTQENKGTDEFLVNMRGKSRGAIKGGRKLPVVYRSYKGPFEQFDARAYPKGAWILHMIRSRLGDETWWQCIQHYVEKNRHRCVESKDLRQAIEETTGRSFGRFFYDWLERPGSPIVDLRFKWKDGDKMAEVHIRQTQKAEAFHIPLEIEFQFADGSRPVAISHRMKHKQDRFFVPLRQRPSMVRVDPRFTVLMELTEHKGRDLWLNQLKSDPNPILRGRAAEHFGKSRRDADRRVLVDALGKEPFWAVQADIATALGKSGGELSRDTLLNALSLEHPKARVSVVEALGSFRDDESVADALRSLAKHGDASYSVEAAAIKAYAGFRPPDASQLLEPLLKRESHNEIVRTAALQGIGQQQDPRSVSLLLSWAATGKPRRCRGAALEALGQIARGGGLDEAATRKIADACTACLRPLESRRVKNAAVQTLRDLGASGTHALPALEALAVHDRNERVRTRAREAIEKIRSGTPARLELKRLRDELDKLRKENRKLSGRLEKLETKEAVPVEEGKGRRAG